MLQEDPKTNLYGKIDEIIHIPLYLKSGRFPITMKNKYSINHVSL